MFIYVLGVKVVYRLTGYLMSLGAIGGYIYVFRPQGSGSIFGFFYVLKVLPPKIALYFSRGDLRVSRRHQCLRC